jgi:hypothetical protein
VSSDAAPVALAGPPLCAVAPPAPGARRGRGVPAETVLRMLRQRVVPIARQCFRADRRGRADYSVRAEFHFELGDREVVRAEVTGAIGEELRRCLLGAVDALDVPAFDGVVVVSYPVRTEAEPLPPTLELRPEVAREVDRVTAP